jgi:hypothetical protein
MRRTLSVHAWIHDGKGESLDSLAGFNAQRFRYRDEEKSQSSMLALLRTDFMTEVRRALNVMRWFLHTAFSEGELLLLDQFKHSTVLRTVFMVSFSQWFGVDGCDLQIRLNSGN